MRYTPFETMDRLFEDLRREMWTARNDWSDAHGDWGFGHDDTAIDLAEHDGEYVLTVDLPGFEREEIDLRYEDGMLVVSASHESGDETTTRRRAVHERVDVPAAVVEDEITASYHNGVLEVHLPVEGEIEEHGRRIDID